MGRQIDLKKGYWKHRNGYSPVLKYYGHCPILRLSPLWEWECLLSACNAMLPKQFAFLWSRVYRQYSLSILRLESVLSYDTVLCFVIRFCSPVNLVHLLCISNIPMTPPHLTDLVASSMWFPCKTMCAFMFSLFIYSPLSLIGEVLLPFSLSVQIFGSLPTWGKVFFWLTIYQIQNIIFALELSLQNQDFRDQEIWTFLCHKPEHCWGNYVYHDLSEVN